MNARTEDGREDPCYVDGLVEPFESGPRDVGSSHTLTLTKVQPKVPRQVYLQFVSFAIFRKIRTIRL